MSVVMKMTKKEHTEAKFRNLLVIEQLEKMHQDLLGFEARSMPKPLSTEPTSDQIEAVHAFFIRRISDNERTVEMLKTLEPIGGAEITDAGDEPGEVEKGKTNE